MSEHYYGVLDDQDLLECARTIADAFGGGNSAIAMSLGTCATETHFGRYPDAHPEKWGVGVAQCDEIGLRDIKMHIRNHDRKVMLKLGYNIDTVRLEDLATDPILALAICRLRYKRVPEPLPAYDDIEGQGRYWKDHYNSHHPNAAGTPEKYVEDFKRHIPTEILSIAFDGV